MHHTRILASIKLGFMTAETASYFTAAGQALTCITFPQRLPTAAPVNIFPSVLSQRSNKNKKQKKVTGTRKNKK